MLPITRGGFGVQHKRFRIGRYYYKISWMHGFLDKLTARFLADFVGFCGCIWAFTSRNLSSSVRYQRWPFICFRLQMIMSQKTDPSRRLSKYDENLSRSMIQSHLSCPSLSHTIWIFSWPLDPFARVLSLQYPFPTRSFFHVSVR